MGVKQELYTSTHVTFWRLWDILPLFAPISDFRDVRPEMVAETSDGAFASKAMQADDR
jgi:hypothetical protein